jgi:thiol-disulfide isomerase/thioredoxin
LVLDFCLRVRPLWRDGTSGSGINDDTVMKNSFALLLLAAFLSVPILSETDIISAVRDATSSGNFQSADLQLQRYRSQYGTSPTYLEALSWMARGELAAKQLDTADRYAKETQRLALEELKHRSLDAEPHLPVALGAAIEVQAQVAGARGNKSEAVSYVKRQLTVYGNTSIAPRLEKNLNLLTMEGQPAPALQTSKYLGPKPPTLASLRGKPVLIYFWAHWCGDCRAEVPFLAQLKNEYAGKGLALLGPTQLYGYAARGEDASPQQELAYIEDVRKRYYTGLSDVPVPVSQKNFQVYGASTTPTLVLLDRKGIVRLYHPGAMRYAELKAAVDEVIAR